jgi:myo-inositol 2-dehydrogenase / D-chiro-inositol 1-dehydrogenase
MKIAFIGTGGIARQHARGLAKRSDLAFVGACDVDLARATAFAKEYGGKSFTNAEEMLDRAKPDAAWVCLPPFAHGEAELALLDRRIPFLVEKPISNNMETAREILEAVERTGTFAAVGYMTRYRRGVQRARELLQDDPPVLAHGAWIGGAPGVHWWRVKALSGGQIVEQTTHTFDLARFLLGEPVDVFARGVSGRVTDMERYDVEDASSVVATFENGAVANLMSSCASRAGGGVHMTVAAMHHFVSFTGWEHSAVIRKSALEEERILGESDIFEIEDAAFVAAVEGNQPELVQSPYADGIKSLAFCLAANRSLETGEVVPLDTL